MLFLRPNSKWFTVLICVAFLAFFASITHSQTLLFEDVPYLSFKDSPFFTIQSVVLEDFEDEEFDIFGVIGISNTPGTELGVGGGSPFTDSVDGDDGLVDGQGFSGRALSELTNIVGTDDLGYTFIFDENVIGRLPSHAGIVWTDGGFGVSTQVEFFDADNNSLGILGPFQISDSTFADSVNEDRFFGCVYFGGIGSFTIRSPGGVNNMTVDHIQYAVEILGDINCDGNANLFDVQPFVEAILNSSSAQKADINQDGVVDLLDVAPFVEILAGG